MAVTPGVQVRSANKLATKEVFLSKNLNTRNVIHFYCERPEKANEKLIQANDDTKV